MATRAVIGLRIESAKAGKEAAERLRGLEGVAVRGAVLSERDGVGAVLIAADDLRALRAAAEEARRVEGVREVVVLVGRGDMWAELARMEEGRYARDRPPQS